MINRYISSKQVVAKIFADLDLKEGPNRIADMYEWVGEAIEKIGSVGQLIRKVSGVNGSPVLEIKQNQTRIPSDLFRLNQVAYSNTPNGPWYPMTRATGTMNTWDINAESKRLGIMQNDALAMISTSTNDNATNTEQVVRGLGYKGVPVQLKLQYSIKPSYINTSVSTGYLKLSYDAIPVDEDGYPLVPDLMSYTEAIYWYVAMKLAYPEYRSGKMRSDIYYDAKRSWNFYCRQAYAESIMPNADEMETIKNTWIRLVPDMASHSDFHESLNEQELIYNFR